MYHGHRKSSTPITRGQITTIKLAVNQLGIGDDDYRDMLEERYRVRSCTGLTFNQAGHFITELQKKGFRLLVKEPQPAKLQHKRHGATTIAGKSSREDSSKIAYMVTAEQLDKINAVAKLIHWRVENGLALFLEKRMGIKDGRIKTYSQFYKAVEGLKSMYENQMKAAFGADWWLMRFEDVEIMKYIREHAPKDFRL